MTAPDEREHLERSLTLAREASASGDNPFGAVLVAADGAVLAEGRNTATSTGDVTAHAEIVALRSVPPERRHLVVGATVHASGEPCPMCAAALVWAGVGRIVFAAATVDFGPLLPPGPSFSLTCAQTVAASSGQVEVVGPVLGAEGLEPFRPSAGGVAQREP
ncbi:tRNA-specific adenosine deaminase [Paraoerskovia sediminicola]|uniref:tRNA-specific adenosine deaminase n=1 Tax=Paraoerskovia sediminicola TaxID=1138587 RepID=A0ABM8G0I9_9CELL|nr:nucleoside deaminase [Paraoerskovia sediminicola]BDZ41404.1 tRNA-specific adenosine deaminase [Paraoerskovia sediminicola]